MNVGPRRGVVWSAVGFGVAALALLFLRSCDRAAATTAGRLAPRFVASTLDSPPGMRSLDDYAGSPILLNIWATWCDPCREEMPSLETLHQDYRPRGLRVVAVSIDNAGDEPLIREFVKENNLTFDVLHDATSGIVRQYAVRGVPQTFLVSRAGHVVATRFAADWSSAEYRSLVDSLLRVGAPGQR